LTDLSVQFIDFGVHLLSAFLGFAENVGLSFLQGAFPGQVVILVG